MNLLLIHRLAVVGLFATIVATSKADEAPPRTVNFEEEIAPILVRRCLECHNENDKKGNLDLTTRPTALAGGDTGVAMIPGHADQSPLVQRTANGEMPPELKGQPRNLPAKEVAALRLWVEAGANWPAARQLGLYERTSDVRAGMDWWSLQPVHRPEIPTVQSQSRISNPIDAFILAELERHGMSMAPEADARTLIRRLYFDLVGLPPTSEQIDAFIADKSPSAYERLVDQLLQSRHYGERWARYWLDLVRFAETCGYERDQLKPKIWRYRDWVINALNEDMPYTQFVTDQLAGDEVSYRDEQSVIATGMLRAGTWNDEPNDPADYVYTRLEDMVHVVSSAFVGLTIKCARCHDHKFDPIKQTDYYRVASFFWAGHIGQTNLGGPSAEELGYDAFGWTDRGSDVEPIHLLIKGERRRPGPVVEPGFPSLVPELDRSLELPPQSSRTTHRRLQLAQWISDPSNPLTARVLVNRLWQHHFGQALVRTPNNFGFKSDAPTHPRLLDWLAADFMEGHWKVKRIHKRIMMSSTYRQASVHPSQHEYEEADFLNRRWWRQNRRRLDAEAVRDAMLASSGQLNREFGGPSFYPRMSPEALEGLSKKGAAWGHSNAEQRARRSIYMMTKRSRLLPMMTTFDFCDTTGPCAQRDVTTVATQALALLNNHFVHEQSEAMASRILKLAGEDEPGQIELVWRMAYGRDPSENEVTMARDHMQRQLVDFSAAAMEPSQTGQDDSEDVDSLKVRDKLQLWLRAGDRVRTDELGRVESWGSHWTTVDGQSPEAIQEESDFRPLLVAQAFGDQPAVRFDGVKQFLSLHGQVVTSQQFTIMAVVSHLGTSDGPREILSNWKRAGPTVTSVFLGSDGPTGVRFTDGFVEAGPIQNPAEPFFITAVNATYAASTYQNREVMASASQLSERDLSAPYVIGTQGDFGNEYWQGDLAEILVYDRALTEDELNQVWSYFRARYDIDRRQPANPRMLALASLCHVLINSNEFVYVD